MLSYVLRSLAIVGVLLFVILFAVRHTRPVYASSGTVMERLRKRAPVAAAVIAPVESSTVARLMASPKYQEEKRNFYEDLMRTGRLDSARADSIAQYAVREAYTRGISPAIVFGVMLTENARFISNAMSNVGAVGLMQVYPKIWLKKEFSDSLGKDLASDSTNLKYGLFILDKYFHPRTRSGDVTERDYRSALLRYNGCVTGSNTPNCKTYPDKVRRYVEASAKSICNGRGFYECIAKPFIAGLMGDDPSKTP
jgi:soluble lytic murein transglycosylase-like protein